MSDINKIQNISSNTNNYFISGEKQYMLSDTYPSELDCAAFAMLSQMIWNMEGSTFHKDIPGNLIKVPCLTASYY